MLQETTGASICSYEPSDLRAVLDRDGYLVAADGVDRGSLDSLVHMLDSEGEATDDGRRHGGRRNLLTVPLVRQIAAQSNAAAAAQHALGSACMPISATLFDKSPQANWSVRWHQDVVVPVEARCDVTGFGPWSVKDDVPHVRPPVEVLEQLLAVRIHLDDCGPENGPLQVLPGTHADGFLEPQAVADARAAGDVRTCCVSRGGVVLMKPLLLHASAKAETPTRRRVLHIVYAACQLPEPLRWSESQAGKGT